MDASLLVDTNTGFESLSTTVLDVLNTHLESDHPENKKVFQQYLRGTALWRDIAPILNNSLWTGTNALIKDGVQQQMHTQMFCSQTTLEHVWPPILLAWGLSQPMGSKIKVPAYMEQWYILNVRDPIKWGAKARDTKDALKASVAFLEHFQALQHVPKQQDATYDIAKHLLKNITHWPMERLNDPVVEQFVIPLGHLVEKVKEPKKHARIFGQWAKYVQYALDRKDTPLRLQLQITLASSIMKSKLPCSYKKVALLTAQPTIWSMNAEHLRPLLPPNEAECFKLLPWATIKNPERLEHWEKENYISTNNDNVRHYCPMLYPLLKLATTDDDWCLKDHIAVWVEHSVRATTPEHAPLPAHLLEP